MKNWSFFLFCNFERAVSDTVPSWTRFWTRFSWQGIYDWLWGMRKTLKFHEDSAKSWVMIIVMLAIFFSCSFDFTDFVNAHFCWSIYIYIIYIYTYLSMSIYVWTLDTLLLKVWYTTPTGWMERISRVCHVFAWFYVWWKQFNTFHPKNTMAGEKTPKAENTFLPSENHQLGYWKDTVLSQTGYMAERLW
jgi:hypothetical protein